MTIQELEQFFHGHPKCVELVGALQNLHLPKICLSGLRGASASLLLSSVAKSAGNCHLVVLNDKEEAAYFLNDLENFWDEKHLYFFPSSYRNPYADDQIDNANVLFRAEALDGISKAKKNLLIVTYPEALAEMVVTKQHLKKNTLKLNKGDSISIEFINELLFDYEFNRVDYVSEPGEFAIRGGIVDVFSFSNENPFRIEFFGDEVDSIRTFDASNQLSIAKHDHIHIVPNVQTKLLREERTSFFDFIPERTTFWIKSVNFIQETLDKEFDKIEQLYKKSKGVQLPPAALYIKGEHFLEALNSHSIVLIDDPTIGHDAEVSFNQKPQPYFNKNFELLVDNLSKNSKDGVKNVILSNNPKQIERLYRIFEDIGKEVVFYPIVGNFSQGFIDEDVKVAVYTDHQIFERYHRFKLRDGFQKTKQYLTLKELTTLQKGDFVTHIDHGVGVFDGLEKIQVNGKEQEAIRLLYRDNDVLYVSIHSLHRIAKYAGKDGQLPSLNKLGTQAWSNLKNKTKSKVKQIAYDLIKLYAARKAKKGYAFAPDSYLQHELESSFIYEDTPDQVKATEDVKADMEAEWPMDRLVCGDVGFGKTEIAVRAAFKAVCESKQVAVLVPTTILTSQHYQTFKNRLSDFPVKIEHINRFKSAKDQKEILKKVAEGEIDIIIGTHRLVGKDVKFKDLGLLIIDEEQKFGVSVKDKLKTFKVNVDTLTLTATPIPRTLQFSLMKARDLSIINTPPPNRYPVQTEIKPFSEEVIRDAVYYEVSRNGQVFFVHNRVQNIKEVCGLIQRLCPEVKVRYAHGQMEGHQLEEVMMDFINHEFDVLVATTIIESGLDISNANTIIINQAQNFGLSDLHQMRGRVGRSNKKAFCYLLAPPITTLTNEARKRLQALEQFSELGSGFNIAMRDLDIRGAGNLLGGEQSGFISEIGFEMYQKILDEALEELKEEEFKDLFADEPQHEKEYVKDSMVETDLNVLLPDDYVNNITERLNLYRQLSDIETPNQLEEYKLMLVDRFGPLPIEAKRLLDIIRLKWIAKHIGFEKVKLKDGKMLCYFISNQQSEYFQSEAFNLVLSFLQRFPDRGVIKEKNQKLYIAFNKVHDLNAAIHLLNLISEKELSKV